MNHRLRHSASRGVTRAPKVDAAISPLAYWNQLISAVIENTARNKVVLTYSTGRTLDASDYTIPGKTISGIELSADKKIHTLTVTESFVPGYPTIQLKSYIAKSITNNVDIWYGVQIDKTAESPDATRVASTVGDMTLHASLPVQSLMKGCLLNDNGTVNYYLKADDWTKKADGSASKLDGTDGQVMVEVGNYYRRHRVISANVDEIAISPYPCAGFSLQEKYYIGAYKASLQRSSSKLASVVNLTADYRGGNNNAAWDAGNNTLLGKPATAISRTNFRAYARNRAAGSNWNIGTWWHSMLIYELFMIEYATRNSQKAVSGVLTAQGYKQGGLGAGVSTVDGAAWNAFSGYYPIIPCGTSNSLANGSGEVAYVVPGFGHASGTLKVNRYRGLENPFGDIWEFEEGNIFHEAAGGASKFYACDNPANFADDTIANYVHAGNLPSAEGYLKTMGFDHKGRMLPLAVGAASNTYYCDYFYTPGLVNAWRAVLRGGYAYSGALAGFAYLNSYSAASSAHANVGARLCYYA
jgi:hypothetical protein